MVYIYKQHTICMNKYLGPDGEIYTSYDQNQVDMAEDYDPSLGEESTCCRQQVCLCELDF